MKKLAPVPYPGVTLRFLLDYYGMNQKELAQTISRPHKTINEIVNGKAAITAGTALQLGTVFPGHPAERWMLLQSEYDLYVARKRGLPV